MEFSLINYDDSYKLISLDESLRMENTRHTAHCCIYCPDSFLLDKNYECNAYISMQMRSDGCLGFPGGFVSKRGVNSIEVSEIVDGLNRELKEEANLDEKYFVTKDDYCFTYHHKGINGCSHFFSKEVSAEDFIEIEKNSSKAEHFFKEVLGITRVPLLTYPGEIRGFPTFLSNKFAGCAKQNLLYVILNKKLASFDYVKKSLCKSEA